MRNSARIFKPKNKMQHCQMCGERIRTLRYPCGQYSSLCGLCLDDLQNESGRTAHHTLSEVKLLREDKVWHVWIDGEHVCECCDFTFEAAVDRLKVRLSPNR